MYLEHFGLREAPFRITPHTEFFFAGADRGATLEALLYAITAGEGLVKVTGEVGSGKTMLCRVLMERLPKSVETIYLAVPSLTRDEMLGAIADELGIEVAAGNASRLVRALQERLIETHAAGRRVVALIDEAHAMPVTTLEEIRLLSNLETGTDKLLQMVLFGQPELDAHLALANMRQLRERITHAFTLAPLPPREIRDYVNFRLRASGYHGPDLFPPEALRIIAEASEGLTRRINIYSDKTLLAAFAAGTHTITADHARAAVSDTQIVMKQRESPRRLALAAGAGLALGLVIGYVAGQLAPPAGEPQVAPVAARPAPQSAHAMSPAPAQTQAAPAQTQAAPAQRAAIPVATATAAPAAPPKPQAAVPAGPAATAPHAVSERLAAGRALLSKPEAHYAVQLLVADARERDYLENYLAEAGRSVQPEQLFLVPAGIPEAPRLGVLYGAFDERGAANAALASLPDNLKQFRPYVRPMEVVREDVKRAEGR